MCAVAERNAELHTVELTGFPQVVTESGIAYGGDQNWFKRPKWARFAGCASVAGANLAAYYGVGTEPDIAGAPVYSQKKYVELQTLMYRHYMHPGYMGFPHVTVFRDHFVQYVKDNGAWASGEIRTEKDWTHARDAFAYIRQAIDEDTPVALLILGHTREEELGDDTWHWMTLTGYDEDGSRVLISNHGKKQWLDVPMVFEPDAKNEVRLAKFTVRK